MGQDCYKILLALLYLKVLADILNCIVILICKVCDLQTQLSCLITLVGLLCLFVTLCYGKQRRNNEGLVRRTSSGL